MNHNLKIITIIQARTSSTRLPGKVLLEATGRPLLSLMIERICRSKYAGKIIVATTTDIEDNVIAELCNKEKIDCFRGHPYDLLDRHYKAAKMHNAHAVVKIPSDCPLIDPIIIDKVLKYYLDNQSSFDYVSNLHPASYPDGNDVEVFSYDLLEKAWEEAQKNYEREHTTPFMWDNPERFRIGNVIWDSGLNFSLSHRWTLDYYEDYLFIKTVFEKFYYSNPGFGLDDILRLTEIEPEILSINKTHCGYNWCMNYTDDLKTIKNQYSTI